MEPMIDTPGLDLEISHWCENRIFVGGVDEAGRGALAGPVVAACVVLPPSPQVKENLFGVRDSKTMTAAERAYWAGQIKQTAISWGVGMIEAAEIDHLGIQRANQDAMALAMLHCPIKCEVYLLDFIHWKEKPSNAFRYKKGEQASLSIAAASVIAKTTRDQIMVELGRVYQNYGFAQNKGYGTKQHRQAIMEFGITPIHRTSFTLTKCYQ